MLVLVTYDVKTEDPAGRRRLRNVAKACVNKGQRVQNSVFECLLDQGEYAQLKHELGRIIDAEIETCSPCRCSRSTRRPLHGGVD